MIEEEIKEKARELVEAVLSDEDRFSPGHRNDVIVNLYIAYNILYHGNHRLTRETIIEDARYMCQFCSEVEEHMDRIEPFSQHWYQLPDKGICKAIV